MKKEFEDTATMWGGFRDMIRSMSDRGRAARPPEQLKREAISWLSLLSSGRATEADAEALTRWRSEDPAREEAYAKAALVWDMLTSIAERAPDPMPTRMVHPEAPWRRVGRRAFLGGGVAAAASVAGYAFVRPPFGLWPSLAELRADVGTGAGEQRRVAIADGLAVELNTRSSLVLRVTSGDDHRIELIAGEAVVVAGPDAASSCTVIAGEGRILAHGAKVDVRFEGAAIRVACIDGSVRVEHGAQAVIVAAQQQVVYDGRGISDIGSVDSAAVTAWQRGLLVFRQARLAYVIEEVNRYRPGRIVLLDQELGGHLIDANFHLDRLENVIVYIQQAFGARVTALPGGIVLVG
jgi:transmembrane sensor